LSRLFPTFCRITRVTFRRNIRTAPEFCAAALHEEDSTIRREMLTACSLLGGESLISYLKHELDIVIDRWNYNPASFCVSATGFRGLRNLGATCYMNATFQQLFHIFAFRYRILTSELAADFQLAVRRLFTELLLSRRKFSARSGSVLFGNDGTGASSTYESNRTRASS
jgi:hypothetical protein